MPFKDIHLGLKRVLSKWVFLVLLFHIVQRLLFSVRVTDLTYKDFDTEIQENQS